jgi:hypothetical protein
MFEQIKNSQEDNNEDTERTIQVQNYRSIKNKLHMYISSNFSISAVQISFKVIAKCR